MAELQKDQAWQGAVEEAEHRHDLYTPNTASEVR